MARFFKFRLSNGFEGGASDLHLALVAAVLNMDSAGLRSAAVFAGQPSDGAKVVARVNLDGLPDHNDRLENCRRYDERMDELELAPNGDDYNALRDMLSGGPYRSPHKDGR